MSSTKERLMHDKGLSIKTIFAFFLSLLAFELAAHYIFTLPRFWGVIVALGAYSFSISIYFMFTRNDHTSILIALPYSIYMVGKYIYLMVLSPYILLAIFLGVGIILGIFTTMKIYIAFSRIRRSVERSNNIEESTSSEND